MTSGEVSIPKGLIVGAGSKHLKELMVSLSEVLDNTRMNLGGRKQHRTGHHGEHLSGSLHGYDAERPNLSASCIFLIVKNARTERFDSSIFLMLRLVCSNGLRILCVPYLGA